MLIKNNERQTGCIIYSTVKGMIKYVNGRIASFFFFAPLFSCNLRQKERARFFKRGAKPQRSGSDASTIKAFHWSICFVLDWQELSRASRSGRPLSARGLRWSGRKKQTHLASCSLSSKHLTLDTSLGSAPRHCSSWWRPPFYPSAQAPGGPSKE